MAVLHADPPHPHAARARREFTQPGEMAFFDDDKMLFATREARDGPLLGAEDLPRADGAAGA
jgi:hypothetical protein